MSNRQAVTLVAPVHAAAEHGSNALLLRRRGFAALLAAQFLGAFNDNLYKMVVSLLTVGMASGGASYLSLASAVFIVPYMLFSGYAGVVADRYGKRGVLVAAKALEIPLMGVALLVLLLGRADLLLAALFLLAVQAVFFSPAKYGLLPEMLPGAWLPRANGLLEMTRYVAIIFGTVAGGFALALWRDRPVFIGVLLLGVALAGFLCSLLIDRRPAAGAAAPLRLNPWHGLGAGLGRLAGDRVLGSVAVALAYFDFVTTLALLDVLLLAKEAMGLDDLRTALIGAFGGFGVALGSVIAGRLCDGRYSAHLVPVGAAALATALLVLGHSSGSYALTLAAAAAMGVFGGLYLVPLFSLLQRHAHADERGKVVASVNFLSMGGVLLASAALWLLHDGLGLAADRILVLSAALTLALTLAALKAAPRELRTALAALGRG